MMAFGWTEEYVDGLDMPRVRRIFRGFEKKPPVHWIGRAFVKIPGAAGRARRGETAGPAPKQMFESMGGMLLDG